MGLVNAFLHGPQSYVLAHLYLQEISVTLVSRLLNHMLAIIIIILHTESGSMSYTGNGYAQYTLTEEGIRHRRQIGETRSTYNDIISFSLRTTYTDGLLFAMYDKTESEYLYITVRQYIVCFA